MFFLRFRYNRSKILKNEVSKPKVIKFIGGDNKGIHRTITAIIKETLGFDRVIDIWLEPISGWEKQGTQLRWYDIEYFNKL